MTGCQIITASKYDDDTSSSIIDRLKKSGQNLNFKTYAAAYNRLVNLQDGIQLSLRPYRLKYVHRHREFFVCDENGELILALCPIQRKYKTLYHIILSYFYMVMVFTSNKTGVCFMEDIVVVCFK